MVERGSVKVLLQLGMTKDPTYPAPLALDVVTDPRDRQLLELVFTPQYLGRPIAAPPGVPAAIVDAFRRAFQDTMRDPEFMAEAGAQKLDINPVTGQQIAEILQRVYALPKPMIARVIELNR
jgi:hypothetical protein